MPTQSPLNAPQLSGESVARTIAPAKASTPSKIETDPRLDPRIKKCFAAMPPPVEKPNVSSREELLAQENSPAALAAMEHQTAFFDSMDSEEIAPSAGLSVRVETSPPRPTETPSRSGMCGRITVRFCHAYTTFTAAAWR
jgi:hypothetical protein